MSDRCPRPRLDPDNSEVVYKKDAHDVNHIVMRDLTSYVPHESVVSGRSRLKWLSGSLGGPV